MAALIEPKDFALLLQDIDHYEGSVVTQYALRIAPLVFVRPGELRHAKWQDIDLEKGLWSYTPQNKIKDRSSAYCPSINSSHSFTF
jgi:integrase